jgi:hypothetical protein
MRRHSTEPINACLGSLQSTGLNKSDADSNQLFGCAGRLNPDPTRAPLRRRTEIRLEAMRAIAVAETDGELDAAREREHLDELAHLCR